MKRKKRVITPEQINNISIDMSPGILEEFPESSIVFDKFHVVKLLNEAMDEIKKKERRVSFFRFGAITWKKAELFHLRNLLK